MRALTVLLCTGLLLLSGCGVTVVPRPASADAQVNPADRSITEIRHGLKVTARVQDPAVVPYRMVDNLASFYVAVVNQTSQPVTIPLDAFLLFDGQHNQYSAIQPTAIQSLVARDSTYLIPYPYVGYYYLEDAQEAGAFNTFESALPFYAESHPQDLLLDAFPVTQILPGARIAGMVYFPIDLPNKEFVELRLYLPGTAVTEPADFVFPFSIEK